MGVWFWVCVGVIAISSCVTLISSVARGNSVDTMIKCNITALAEHERRIAELEKQVQSLSKKLESDNKKTDN